MTVGTSAIVDRTALYRFFDSTGALLYVGITASPSTRFTLHSKKSPWWEYVDHARTTVEYHETRTLAAAAELAAIKSEGPKWNIAGVHGMGGRPATVLTEEQELLLGQADEAVRQARAAEEEMWAGVVAARKGGVPDLIICQATGISRATLNRRFGNRKAIEQKVATDE